MTPQDFGPKPALENHDAYDIEEAARAERRKTAEPATAIVVRMIWELYDATAAKRAA